MNTSPYLTRRPHFYLTILVVIIAFLLLSLAAAKIFFDDEPTQTPSPAPTEKSEPAQAQ